jgi:death-on-curing protein
VTTSAGPNKIAGIDPEFAQQVAEFIEEYRSALIELSAEQVLFTHSRVIEETGGSHGVRDLNMLLSAIGRSQASFDDQDLYQDLFNKAAALMESLILNHPFVDGNKSTGVTATGLFLHRNDYRLTASNAALVAITMSIARSEINIADLSIWLQDNSQPAE